MKSIIIVFLILTSTFLVGQEISFNKQDFEDEVIVYKKQKIPRKIKAELKKQHGYKLRFSNPNKDYESTDNHIGFFSKASRRLIFFAKYDSFYMIYYEHSGWGHHCHCIIFQKNNTSEIKNVISLEVSPKKESVQNLKKILINNEVKIKLEGECRF